MWICEEVSNKWWPRWGVQHDLSLGQKLGSRRKVTRAVRLGCLSKTSPASSFDQPEDHRLGRRPDCLRGLGSLCLRPRIFFWGGSRSRGADLHLSRWDGSGHSQRILWRPSGGRRLAQVCQRWVVRSLENVFCGFCSNRILHYFPMLVSPSQAWHLKFSR